jgi:hypothetical protein
MYIAAGIYDSDVRRGSRILYYNSTQPATECIYYSTNKINTIAMIVKITIIYNTVHNHMYNLFSIVRSVNVLRK